MKTEMRTAKQALHCELETQIKLTETNKDASKAHAEIKAIAEMLMVLVLFEAH